MLDGGKLGYFYDRSHSPDKIWQINLGSEKIFIMIQDKNVDELSFLNYGRKLKRMKKLERHSIRPLKLN